MRTFWIIWCSAWALFWMLAGFVFFPVWLLVPVSLFAILIPIGSQAQIERGCVPEVPSSTFDKRFTEDQRRDYFRG